MALRNCWNKFIVWIYNIRIDIAMQNLQCSMVEHSNAKLFGGSSSVIERKQRRYAKDKRKFHRLLNKRDDFAYDHNVRPHPNSPENWREIHERELNN